MARTKITLDRQRISVMLPKRLYTTVVRVCEVEGTTITNAVREALLDWVKKKVREKKELEEELTYD